jgi:hypothetical protein
MVASNYRKFAHLFLRSRRSPAKDHHPEEADEDGRDLDQQAVGILPLADPYAKVYRAGKEDQQRGASDQYPPGEAVGREAHNVAEFAVAFPELVDALRKEVMLALILS